VTSTELAAGAHLPDIVPGVPDPPVASRHFAHGAGGVVVALAHAGHVHLFELGKIG
jgi:hypothetical protein